MDELKGFIKECINAFLPKNNKMSEPSYANYKGYGDCKPVVKPIPVKREDPDLDLDDDNWI